MNPWGFIYGRPWLRAGVELAFEHDRNLYYCRIAYYESFYNETPYNCQYQLPEKIYFEMDSRNFR